MGHKSSKDIIDRCTDLQVLNTEAAQCVVEHFDTNHDGQLDRKEFSKFMEKN